MIRYLIQHKNMSSHARTVTASIKFKNCITQFLPNREILIKVFYSLLVQYQQYEISGINECSRSIHHFDRKKFTFIWPVKENLTSIR